VVNVLFIPSWYPSREKPIYGIFAQRRVHAIARFANVRVATFDYRSCTPHIDRELDNGVTTLRIYPGSGPMRVVNTMRYLSQICREFHCDIIDAHCMRPAGYIARYLFARHDIPYVLTEYTNPFSAYFDGWLASVASYSTLQSASRILADSESCMLRILPYCNVYEKYRVVYNVVDTDVFHPLPPTASASPPERDGICHIAHVTTMDERFKNTRLLIDATKVLMETRTDFDVTVIGDGRDKDATVAYAREQGVPIRFTGMVLDVSPYLRKADFLAITSVSENFMVAGAEALMSGIPLVSTHCGGPENYMLGVATDGNRVAYANAMDWMIDHHHEFDRQQLHEYARRLFSYDVIGKKIVDIYQEVLNE